MYQFRFAIRFDDNFPEREILEHNIFMINLEIDSIEKCIDFCNTNSLLNSNPYE